MKNGRIRRGARRWMRRALPALILLAVVVAAFPGGAVAEQASQPTSLAAGYLTTGNFHSCAVLTSEVRCWGYGGDGQLGYGNTKSIGDDETPGSVGPVDLDPGPGVGTAKAISAGSVHTCALLADGTVRCWGFGANGRLGYGNTDTIGDNEAPGSIGAVDLDPGPGVGTAKAISAGNGHTCAILADDTVRCWGFGVDGRLGYGNTDTIGDNEAPGSIGAVDLDPGPGVGTAKAISAGGYHTCAILTDGTVRCWGFGGNGRLGYGNAGCPLPGQPGSCPPDIGRTPTTTPDTAGPVDLDPGPGVGTAKAISAGLGYTCAILDNGTVRCWGSGGSGQLGYGNTRNIGDDETPDSVGPVDLDPGPGLGTAKAINAGDEHTCAVLNDDKVRCWGYGAFGQLGYGNGDAVGDVQPPGSAGPVELGPGRTATAISAGALHTCARLNDDSVRCWGRGSNGRLGYCKEVTVGDNETPGSVGPVDLGVPGMPGDGCPVVPSPSPPPPGGDDGSPPAPSPPPKLPSNGSSPPLGKDPLVAALAAQKARTIALNACIAKAKRTARPKRDSARRACLKRYGRTPGRVKALKGRGKSKTTIVLSFTAPGTDGDRPPAARTYLVKQSPRAIGGTRDFARAQTLCKGRCAFKVTRVGTKITLTIIGLLPKTTYYYAVAALDNVSGKVGPRSAAVKVKTR